MRVVLVLLLVLLSAISFAEDSKISIHCSSADMALWQDAGRTESKYWLKGLTNKNAMEFAKLALNQTDWLIEKIKQTDPKLLERYGAMRVSVAQTVGKMTAPGMNIPLMLRCHVVGVITLGTAKEILDIQFHDGAFSNDFYCDKDKIVMPGMEKSNCYAILATHEMLHVRRIYEEKQDKSYPSEEVATDHELFSLLEKESEGKLFTAMGLYLKMTEDIYDKSSIVMSFASLNNAELALFGKKVPRNLALNAMPIIVFALTESKAKELGLSPEDTHKECVTILKVMSPEWVEKPKKPDK